MIGSRYRSGFVLRNPLIKSAEQIGKALMNHVIYSKYARYTNGQCVS